MSLLSLIETNLPSVKSLNWKRQKIYWPVTLGKELLVLQENLYTNGRNSTWRMFCCTQEQIREVSFSCLTSTNLLLRHLYDNIGHMGAERVLGLARDHFYWPYIKQYVETYVAMNCPWIKQKNVADHIWMPMGSITSTSPIKLVSIDYLHLELSREALKTFWLSGVSHSRTTPTILRVTLQKDLTLPCFKC